MLELQQQIVGGEGASVNEEMLSALLQEKENLRKLQERIRDEKDLLEQEAEALHQLKFKVRGLFDGDLRHLVLTWGIGCRLEASGADLRHRVPTWGIGCRLEASGADLRHRVPTWGIGCWLEASGADLRHQVLTWGIRCWLEASGADLRHLVLIGGVFICYSGQQNRNQKHFWIINYYDLKGCNMSIFFVRLRRFLLTLNKINILCSVYSLCATEIVFKLHKVLFFVHLVANYYFTCAEIWINWT